MVVQRVRVVVTDDGRIAAHGRRVDLVDPELRDHRRRRVIMRATSTKKATRKRLSWDAATVTLPRRLVADLVATARHAARAADAVEAACSKRGAERRGRRV